MRSLATNSAAVRAAGEAPTYRYRAFGLVFDSELELPELDRTDRSLDADVRIRLRPINRTALNVGRSTYEYSSTEQFLHWPGVGSFLIRGTGVIDIEAAPGAGAGLLRLPLLGPVMALLLHLRGMLVLHASAVSINGRIAVFVGNKGAGKSTTTAAAVERGHLLFTDDLLALSFAGTGQPEAFPGFPSVKLVSDCSHLFSLQGADDLAAPIADFPKQIRRLRNAFADAPAMPARIYVLKRANETSILPCLPDEALRMIMRFAYIPLFERKPWQADEAQRHFTQCASIASKVQVAHLETPSDLGRMSEIIACVETDLACSNAPS